jgi:hypothetical protein
MISVLKKRAVRHQNLQSQMRLKVRPPTLFHTLPFFKLYMPVPIDQVLAYQCMSRLVRLQKSKVMEMVQSRFYSLDETMVKLNVGLAMEFLM